MSILKGILHHWNKTNSAYDTIHPETEVSQVTDWNSGIVNTLASTALGSLVTTLSSDSLLAKLIEKVLSATGVKYQTGTKGYLCLGSLFGGVIIQWGNCNVPNGLSTFYFPIAFNIAYALIAVPNDDGTALYRVSSGGFLNTKFNIRNTYDSTVNAQYIAIGK